MKNIEKKIFTILVVIIIIFCVSIGYVSYSITAGGGIKQVLIEAGKEIKEIKREIENG